MQHNTIQYNTIDTHLFAVVQALCVLGSVLAQQREVVQRLDAVRIGRLEAAVAVEDLACNSNHKTKHETKKVNSRSKRKSQTRDSNNKTQNCRCGSIDQSTERREHE